MLANGPLAEEENDFFNVPVHLLYALKIIKQWETLFNQYFVLKVMYKQVH